MGEALEAGMTPQQIEDKLLPMLEEFKPKINQMMAETGQDKKTVVKTLIKQKYQELESSVGITWESLGATVEEALAAVRAEAAVGEEVDESDGESDSSSEEDRLFFEEIIEDEKKEHAAPLLDEKYKEALEAGMTPQQKEDSGQDPHWAKVPGIGKQCWYNLGIIGSYCRGGTGSSASRSRSWRRRW